MLCTIVLNLRPAFVMLDLIYINVYIYCILQYMYYMHVRMYALCVLCFKSVCMRVIWCAKVRVVEPAPHQQWEAQIWLGSDMKRAATHKRAPVREGQRLNISTRHYVLFLAPNLHHISYNNNTQGLKQTNTMAVHYNKHIWSHYLEKNQQRKGGH